MNELHNCLWILYRGRDLQPKVKGPRCNTLDIKGLFGMAPLHNSSNSNKKYSQTPQLQNSMKLSTLWSCSANRDGVLEHLFCCSKTSSFKPPRGVGSNYPPLPLVTHIWLRTVMFFSFSSRISITNMPRARRRKDITGEPVYPRWPRPPPCRLRCRTRPTRSPRHHATSSARSPEVLAEAVMATSATRAPATPAPHKLLARDSNGYAAPCLWPWEPTVMPRPPARPPRGSGSRRSSIDVRPPSSSCTRRGRRKTIVFEPRSPAEADCRTP